MAKEVGAQLGRGSLLQRSVPGAAQQHENRSRLKVLIWFRRDLRSYDHRALEVALREGVELKACFVFDSRWQTTQPEGFSRMGPRQFRFLEQSVDELAAGLAEIGLSLERLKGDPVEAVVHYAMNQGIEEVWASEAWAFEERSDEELVGKQLKLRLFQDFTLHPELPFPIERLPKVFTEFRKQIEKRNYQPQIEGIPWTRAAEYPEREADFIDSAFPFKGGQYQALARIKNWFPNHIQRYKETRNEMLGSEFSSKLSAYLAWGCISPSTVWAEIKRFEQRHGSNESTYWLGFELLWREFFLWTWQKSPRSFYGYPKDQSKVFIQASFERWRTGNTGNRWIDAHMRELLKTGYMSNRGRQNVASFLIWDLKVDWVMGARWFEHALVDYEPCNNYGNWTYLAGVGNDPRGSRRFDPDRQQSMYDPEASHARLWLGE